MTASGIDAQFGMVDESTYDTLVTVTRFLEFVEEGVKKDISRVESKGLRAGRRTLHRWAPGKEVCGGPISFELSANGMGLLFKHMFGAVNTSGAGPYTHTFTPGAIDGKSFTFQFGRPDLAGTVQPFTYGGGKIKDWEIKAAVDEYAMLLVNVAAASETTATALAAAAYPAAFAPFVYTKGSLTVAGSPHDVKTVSLKGDNGLAIDRHFVRATTPAKIKEPKESTKRAYTGALEADFENLTAYNRFVNGTEAALVLTFSDGASSQLVVTCNVRFDGETPGVKGAELLGLSLPFKCTSGTSDAAAITAVLTNGDSTP